MKNQIVMNDFKSEYNFFETDIQKTITKTLKSGWYILGKNVQQFEQDFARFNDAKYCIGVANGLEALQISLMALGVGSGDEVLTVSNTAVATALAITNVGAKPVLVDVDEYFNMDASKIEEKITKKTKAILPVHLFGQSADMIPILKIAKKHNLFVVEDACQSHGAAINGKKVGTFGQLGCFSFYPTKNLGGYGDGGAIITNSKTLAEKCQMIRNYGQKNRYIHELKGINSRLDEIQAAILSVKLRKLDQLTKRRQKIADLYRKYLLGVDQIQLPNVREGFNHVYHLFVIQAANREDLIKYLIGYIIQSQIHYPVPIHKQECYKGEFANLTLPKTEKFAKEILSLPIHPFMTEDDVKKVCFAIKKFYEKK